METETLKGTKNYTPEEQILREKIIKIIKDILERYGFNPIETPILQPYSLLSSKYGGGEEILKECYKLKDRGNRKLGLRYELTITLAQYLNENPSIKLPFKRYEIGKIFRDGPIKKTRAREFTQIDFDIIGAKSELAELEILSIFEMVFKKLNLDVKIQLNNRKILLGLLEYAGVKKGQNSIILTIDKLEKIGEEGVKKELIEKDLKREQIEKIFNVLEIKGNNEKILSELKEILKTKNGREGIEELEKILELSKNYNLKNIILVTTLARGLSYYTGPIFEVFSQEKTSSSLAAGGRYDKLFSKFVGKDLPSVGGSFGLDAISSILKTEKKSKVYIYLIPVGISEDKFLPIVKKLREKYNTDFDLLGRGISKNLEFADKNNIPYCIIIGKQEIKSNKVKLKNMKTGEEKILGLEEIFELI
ncbi:MAG: histidine--tRNA ligase [Candidatus Aenigmarchaeota archaeon]|nr:histidine--tRNA ligase [Candidatus Aenigmarchaeota archaeon]